MPGAAATDALDILNSGGGPPTDRGGRGGGDFRSREPAPASERERRMYLTGVSLSLAAILMFFMALASSYIVRKGTGNDWQPIDLPRIMWLNTAILVASSITIEVARRKLIASGDVAAFRNWWAITTALGMLFLGGQIVAWRELAEQGLFLSTNPSSSFFYLLTAAHGAHLLFGLVALLYVALRAAQPAWRRRAIAAEATAVYWHFLDGLWVFLLLLLNFGR
ncbi:MAG: heme-copper oxidase subunit III [Acidobacteria bacterium]|nr:heme-copper oxidase subunit III [Acidobacteriota bacterium]MBI3664198.1 heme-copper oxidase subunit III [Acidobacteriota bacterium]